MKEILCYDLDGNFLREFRSAAEAERELGVCNQNVLKCCLGKYRSTGGFKFTYKKDMERTIKKVAQLNRFGQVVAIYESISDASRKTGFAKPNICACINKRIKSCGGFGWRAADENTKVEAEMDVDTGKKFRLPFTYQQICRHSDAAVRIVGELKGKVKGDAVERAAKIVSALSGIEIGLAVENNRLCVLFNSGFAIYMKNNPLRDNFVVLLARIVLACGKVCEVAGVDYCGFFDGRWVDIVRVGNDLDGMIRERGV